MIRLILHYRGKHKPNASDTMYQINPKVHTFDHNLNDMVALYYS